MSAPDPYMYVDPLDLRALVRETKACGRLQARTWVRVERIACKKTRRGDDYFEVTVADGEGNLALKAWPDSRAYLRCGELSEGAFVEVSAQFAFEGDFGVGAPDWNWRPLEEAEIEVVMQPNEETRERQKADYAYIRETVAALEDPRLAALGAQFLEEFGERFRRTAAARNYHHARRGGLVEHVAMMMRTAEAICGVYPYLNRDLVVTGVLFHDCGKLWESTFNERSFRPVHDVLGELLGHISIGIELVNKLWKTVQERPEAAAWTELQPPSEDVRRHLLHLIASHHGTREFGSPVEPKTPEAIALHYVDNLDAKLEMMRGIFQNGEGVQVAPGIYDRVRPFTTNLVEPLPAYIPPPVEEPTVVAEEPQLNEEPGEGAVGIGEE